MKKRTSFREPVLAKKYKTRLVFRGGSASRRRFIDVQDVSRDHEAYLDDGVWVFGLAVALTTSFPWLAGRSRGGAVFGSVPLRRGSGQNERDGVGVVFPRRVVTLRIARNAGNEPAGVGSSMSACCFCMIFSCVFGAARRKFRRRGGSAGGGGREARRARSPGGEPTRVARHRGFRAEEEEVAVARGAHTAPSATLSRSLRGSSGARVRGRSWARVSARRASARRFSRGGEKTRHVGTPGIFDATSLFCETEFLRLWEKKSLVDPFARSEPPNTAS